MSYERVGFGALSLRAPAAITSTTGVATVAPTSSGSAPVVMSMSAAAPLLTPEQSLSTAAQQYNATRAPLATAPSSTNQRAPAASATPMIHFDSMSVAAPVLTFAPLTPEQREQAAQGSVVVGSEDSQYLRAAISAPTASASPTSSLFPPASSSQDDSSAAFPENPPAYTDGSSETCDQWDCLSDADKKAYCQMYPQLAQCGSQQLTTNKGTATGGAGAVGLAAAAGLAALLLLKR